MTFLALLLLQTAPEPAPIQFDLSKVETPKGCLAPARAGEIVVCSRRRLPNRLEPLAPAQEGLPRAEFKVFGNVQGSVHVEQGSVGNIPTNRAMVTLKVPF